MKASTLLFVLFLLLISASASAQFGIRSFYNVNSTAGWDQALERQTGIDSKTFAPSGSIALDYWFQLKSARIELYPMLQYHYASSIHNTNSSDYIHPNLRQYGFGIASHIYVMDLEGDCNCPTFSKQGSFFSKGFFLLAGAGVDVNITEIRSAKESYVKPNLSVGAGLDIGISDLLTITPIVQYRYQFPMQWDELQAQSSSYGRVMFGARLGFRLDYKE